MAARIRRAWQELPACVGTAQPGSTAFLEGVREWLRTRVPQVSKKVGTALPISQGVGLFLRGNLHEMPTCRSAVRDLLTAVERDDSRGPERFLEVVDRLARQLAVFRDADTGCPGCGSGDLEMWSDGGGDIFFVCGFMGCTHDADLRTLSGSLDDLRPASRAQVLARYPAADLEGPPTSG